MGLACTEMLGVTGAVARKTMNHPWMIVVGAALIGWLAVQVFAVFGNARIPMPMNVMGAVAFALIAGGLVL